MQDFGDMGERERTIEPRVDDDFDMLGMQFNVTQYADKDKLLSDGQKYGISGFAGQVNRVRGTETNSLFLAEAGWRPNLTPQEFYKDYSQRLFGETAAPEMYKAFMILEKNQEYLGYNNDQISTMPCCTSLSEVRLAYTYSQQPNIYDGPTFEGWKNFIVGSPDVIHRLEGSMAFLNEALQQMQAALPKTAPRGRYELRYLMNRTQSYRDFMHSLITIRRAYTLFDRAFQEKSQISHEQFVNELEKSMSEFTAAKAQAEEATREYAEIMDSPSDLGVLYHMNARGILGMSMVCETMQNVVNFQEGKPYLQHVPWDTRLKADVHTAVAP